LKVYLNQLKGMMPLTCTEPENLPDDKDKHLMELIDVLGSALTEASEHLDYCGYGDAWERECADSESLPGKIETAVEKYEEHLKSRGDKP